MIWVFHLVMPPHLHQTKDNVKVLHNLIPNAESGLHSDKVHYPVDLEGPPRYAEKCDS